MTLLGRQQNEIALLFILSFIWVYASSLQLEELLSCYQRPFTMMAIGKNKEAKNRESATLFEGIP